VARLALLVICLRCGVRFDTAVRTDTESFRKGSFVANYHRCPACGERATYRKADYLVVDARAATWREAGAANEGDGATGGRAASGRDSERE
jgi:DNA-directed RNA polymerase subunit RPC12/RpoP